MTQAQLGNLLGVTGRQVGNYESGKHFPRDEAMILKLARRFGVSADYLLGLTSLPNYRGAFGAFARYNALGEEARRAVDRYLEFEQWRERQREGGKP